MYVQSALGEEHKDGSVGVFNGIALSGEQGTDEKFVYHDDLVATDAGAVDCLRYALEPYERQYNTLSDETCASVPPANERMTFLAPGNFACLYVTRRPAPHESPRGHAQQPPSKRARTGRTTYVNWSIIWARPLYSAELTADMMMDLYVWKEHMRLLLKEPAELPNRLVSEIPLDQREGIITDIEVALSGQNSKSAKNMLKNLPKKAAVFPVLARCLHPSTFKRASMEALVFLRHLLALIRSRDTGADKALKAIDANAYTKGFVTAADVKKNGRFPPGSLYVAFVDQATCVLHPHRERSNFHYVPELSIDEIARLTRHFCIRRTSNVPHIEKLHLTLAVYDFARRAFAQNDADGHTECALSDLGMHYQRNVKSVYFRATDKKRPWTKLSTHESAMVHFARMRYVEMETEGRRGPYKKLSALFASPVQTLLRRSVAFQKQYGRFARSLWKTLSGGVVCAYDHHKKETAVLKKLNSMVDEWRKTGLAGVDKATLIGYLDKGSIPPTSPVFKVDIYPNRRDFQEIWRTLDLDQKHAVCNVVLSPLSFIMGAPGTGKTQALQASAALWNKSQSCAAPYGIISRMLERRTGVGYTCHRLGGIMLFADPTTSLESFFLHASKVLAIDEFELVTVDHLYRMLCSSSEGSMANGTQRVVCCGDIEQSGAIGGGSIVDSIWSRFANDSNIMTCLRIPYRFLTADELRSPDLKQLASERPPSTASARCIPWNTHQMALSEHADAQTHVPDLMYSTDPTDRNARVLVFPIGDKQRAANGQPNIEDFDSVFSRVLGRDYAQKLMSDQVQVLTHTNAYRRALTKSIVQRARADRGVWNSKYASAGRSFCKGDKITFAKNMYLSRKKRKRANSRRGGNSVEACDGDDSDEDDNEVRDDFDIFDVVGQHLATRMASKKSTRGNAEKDRLVEMFFDQRATTAETQAQRTEFHRGTKSDDVFNGEVKILSFVACVDDEGTVVKKFESTDALLDAPRVPNAATVLVFTDNSQVIIGDLEWGDILHGAVFTHHKYHGEQCDTVVLITDDVRHISMRDLRTCMTRAKKRFIFLTGATLREATLNLESVLSHRDKPRRERFAQGLSSLSVS